MTDPFGYAGFCPDCTGMIAYTSGNHGARETAKFVGQLIRDGFRVEPVPVERARLALKRCDESCPRIARKKNSRKRAAARSRLRSPVHESAPSSEGP